MGLMEMLKEEENLIAKRDEELTERNIFSDCNKVIISGILEKEFTYIHSYCNERYYISKVRIERYSGVEDRIPVIVSEKYVTNKMLDPSAKYRWVEVAGQFQSYNTHNNTRDGRSHLMLFVVAKEIKICGSEYTLEEVNYNSIYLKGFICKEPVFRETPLGKEVADIFIAVHRRINNSDYIPCIAWNKTARRSQGLVVGDCIKIVGRIQSRKYFKRYSPESEEGEYREVYEISINRILPVED